ncbi:MAG TPA: VCBS repeat-containing protein [Verrucomicrobiae bacterium]|nr:VCBS repeat-containing protein [Verrucomicrobiae bacterium]
MMLLKTQFGLALLLGIASAAAAPLSSATDTNGLDFGFSGPEIFPIDSQISQLHAADLDGDGLKDLVVVNNARSRINLLYNQTGKTNTASLKPTGRLEMNELPPDARFRIDSIASEKRISALVVEDLNSDGRPDIAYYGDPRELIVLYNEGTNNWSSPTRFEIDDGQLSPNALCAGDLNGDGRTDLVLLGDSCVYLIGQKKDHTLGEPKKIPFSGTVRSIQTVDIDGNGRTDLLLVNWEDRTPFRFRLQKADGDLGPENYFNFPSIRSYWADSLEASNKTQIITIAQNSGRAQISEFTRKAAEPLSGALREGEFQLLPLNQTDAARRGLLWADVNGDGLPDLLAAQPDSGQLTVYLQEKDGTLGSGKTFPTLAGVTDIAVADWDGDGKPEIFILSPDERKIGVTRFEEKQRVPFPELIPIEGKPLALAVGKLNPKDKAVLAVITEQEGTGDEANRRALVLRSADGKVRKQNLSKSFKATPSSLGFADANQDGWPDLVLLAPYEKIKIFVQRPGKDFEEVDVAPPGGALEQPWASVADVDGDGKPELLLPQKNFLRAVALKADAGAANSTNKSGWTFEVKDQINGAASNSRLVGAAAVPNGTNAVPSIFLLDAERKELTLCERDKSGVWQIARNLPLPVSDFSSLRAVPRGGEKINSLALMGLNAVGTLRLDGSVWDLKELDGYETPIKNGRLNDVVSGDLNNDGRKDLVFLETGRHYLDLVVFNSKHKLIPANRWQVFEERTFRSRGGDLPEPREAVVADLTGDGKNDLAVLVHDRILLYPQE